MDDQEVLSIVCSNNQQVRTLLESVEREPSTFTCAFGTSSAELQALAQSNRARILLIDTVLPDGSGFELCRSIKKDESTANTIVVLVQSGAMGDEETAAAKASGCNDIVTLPIHAEDFYCHLGQFAPILFRTVQRIEVDMQVELRRDGKTISGTVQNMTSNGLGLHSNESIELGPVNITLLHNGRNYDGIEGRVIWCRENPEEQGHSIGLNFGQLPPHARELLVKLSLFQIRPNEGGPGVTVSMQGGIDERTDLSPLLAELEGQTDIDFMMQGVTYLSSCGVRSWCLFVEALAPTVTYSFRNCSLAFAAQASMVPMTVGSGKVHSMQAPYFCEGCDREESRLVDSILVTRETGKLRAPPLHCHICGSELEFDDLPERYFAFLGA